jgi:hypothetical protein
MSRRARLCDEASAVRVPRTAISRKGPNRRCLLWDIDTKNLTLPWSKVSIVRDIQCVVQTEGYASGQSQTCDNGPDAAIGVDPQHLVVAGIRKTSGKVGELQGIEQAIGTNFSTTMVVNPARDPAIRS